MSSNKTQYVVTAYIKDKKGRVLAIGKNSYVKTHPEMVKLGKKVGYLNNEKPFIHAEIDAINRCVNLDKAHLIEVYVCTDRSKVYRNSTPCSICEAPTVCMHAVSGSISLPSRGSFRLSLTVLVHYRSITSI